MNKAKQTRQERAVAFIPVRLSSSRLPRKHFRQIGTKTVLQWLLDNLKKCTELDDIVIATAAEPENEPLKHFSQQHRVPLFWYEGDLEHVTTRLRKAAEKFNADICLLISGDCPLVHAPSIDQLIKKFRCAPKADILTIDPNKHDQHPALEGVILSRLQAWQKADDLADKPELKEHQFPLFWTRPELFTRCKAILPSDFYIRKHRFSVDTWADLEFMNKLHNRLEEMHQDFQLPEVLQLLHNEPALFEINSHVHQRKLVDETHKVLFVIDSGGKLGFGHLMRSLELARQLTERKGWPVTFAVNDEETERLLNQQGQKTIWATFQQRLFNTSKGRTITDLTQEFSLLILDIYDQHDLASNWRNEFKAQLKIVVIDNRRPWTSEADLVITPGVTASRTPANRRIEQPSQHLAGVEYLILRREIRQQQLAQPEKALDLLVYLHDEQQRRQFTDFATQHNLKAKIISCFTVNLPELMAAAKLYISGFGISFYEALALKTLPICWPDSTAHHADALTFFKHFELPQLIINGSDEIGDLILPLLAEPSLPRPTCTDGTSRIVDALSRLVNDNL